jgi:hypothetical protein
MTKRILSTALMVLGMAALIAPVSAATTFLLTPVSVEHAKSGSFTLTIVVNPQGVKNYTVRAELDYPADIVAVKSFTFANDWLPLIKPGYDLIDNAKGVLIKTAGYPGGISGSTVLGTVIFSPKKAGSGTIKVGENSLALDARSKNVLGPPTKAVVVITAPAAPPAKEATPKIPEEEKLPPEATTTPAPPPPPLFDIKIGPAAEQPQKTEIPTVAVVAGIALIVAVFAVIYILRSKKIAKKKIGKPQS